MVGGGDVTTVVPVGVTTMEVVGSSVGCVGIVPTVVWPTLPVGVVWVAVGAVVTGVVADGTVVGNSWVQPANISSARQAAMIEIRLFIEIVLCWGFLLIVS